MAGMWMVQIFSGRMGMLIMLYLIQINTYNSVKAPPKRGFSSIEIWFAGMQAPILIAIFEYGLVLGMKKFLKKMEEKLFRAIDCFALIACTVYFFLFTSTYFYFI